MTYDKKLIIIQGPLVKKYFLSKRKKVVIRDINSLRPLLEGNMIINKDGVPEAFEVQILEKSGDKILTDASKKVETAYTLPKEVVAEEKEGDNTYLITFKELDIQEFQERPPIRDENSHIAYDYKRGAFVVMDKKIVERLSKYEAPTIESNLEDFEAMLERLSKPKEIKTDKDGFIDLESLGSIIEEELDDIQMFSANIFRPHILEDASMAVPADQFDSAVVYEHIRMIYIYIDRVIEGKSMSKEIEVSKDELKGITASRYILEEITIQKDPVAKSLKMYVPPKIIKKRMPAILLTKNDGVYIFLDKPVPHTLEEIASTLAEESLLTRYLTKVNDKVWNGIKIDYPDDKELPQIIKEQFSKYYSDAERFYPEIEREIFGEKEGTLSSIVKFLSESEYRRVSTIVRKAFSRTSEYNYRDFILTMLDTPKYSTRIKKLVDLAIKDNKIDLRKLRSVLKGEIITRILLATWRREGHRVLNRDGVEIK